MEIPGRIFQLTPLTFLYSNFQSEALGVFSMIKMIMAFYKLQVLIPFYWS